MPEKLLNKAIGTMMVSLVTPGKTKSSILGVTIYFFPVLGSLKTKKTLDVPTYPIFPLCKYNTCWKPFFAAFSATLIVGP